MIDGRIQRAARQHLEIDRLLGATAAPLGDGGELLAMLSAPTTAAPTTTAPPTAALHEPVASSQPAFARRSPAAAPAARPAPARRAAGFDVGGRPDEPLPADTMTADEKHQALQQLAQEHETQCPHCSGRHGQCNMVFGEGAADAQLMFIGEGPGAEEDRLGRPFVGRAGQLLDKQIAAMGLAREDVYIANIVKTRPPNNRVPTPEEAQLCMPFLQRQIEIIHPAVIVSLGATSAKYLLGNAKLAITRERGIWREFRGIHLMPTFHPAYLLRAYTKENRQRVWDDLKAVLEKLDLPVPGAA